MDILSYKTQPLLVYWFIFVNFYEQLHLLAEHSNQKLTSMFSSSSWSVQTWSVQYQPYRLMIFHL